MSTKRKRYVISVDDRMFEKIENFKDEHYFTTRSSAIQELIRLGIVALEEQQKEKERKK